MQKTAATAEFAASLVIAGETAADIPAREALLDRAMGPKRRKKSSEKLRRGRLPAEGLAFSARDAAGNLVGTVRLWDVAFAQVFSLLEGEMAAQQPEGVGQGSARHKATSGTAATTPPVGFAATLPLREREGSALLLGPLAVEPSLKGAGVGSALMRVAIAEARSCGHKAILLVGDPEYYARFGFTAEKTGNLAMPGPYERHRFLALELEDGALDGAAGILKASGRKATAARTSLAA